MTTEFNFTFTDRASYLAYRAGWKAKYKALSTEIREAKRAIAAGAKAGRDVSALQSKLMEGPNVWTNTMGLSYAARTMLEELAAAKMEAGRQYQAQLAEVAHAA